MLIQKLVVIARQFMLLKAYVHCTAVYAQLQLLECWGVSNCGEPCMMKRRQRKKVVEALMG